MKQRCVVLGNVTIENNKKYEVVYESMTIPVESSAEIPDFDVLFTNVPLQAFSVASRDKKVNPFNEIMVVVNEKRPKMVVLENVGGLLLYQEGRMFKTMCKAMDTAGYVVSQERDSKTGRFYVKEEKM